MLKTDKYVQLQNTCVYIWVNYNISLTWIKAIWGWFPLLTMIPVRSQWGRYNLPQIYIYIYIYIYNYIYIYTSTHTLVGSQLAKLLGILVLSINTFYYPQIPRKLQKVKVRNCHESAKIGFFQGSRFYKNQPADHRPPSAFEAIRLLKHLMLEANALMASPQTILGKKYGGNPHEITSKHR